MKDPHGRETRVLTWQDFHRDALALARLVRDDGPWHTIAAVTRGGMFPAAILAVELGIRRVETVSVASYEGRRRGEPEVLKAGQGSGEGWLVVDDIVDTGATAGVVRNLLPEACFVALYVKPDGEPFVDRYVAGMPQQSWVVFPWDPPAEDA